MLSSTQNSQAKVFMHRYGPMSLLLSLSLSFVFVTSFRPTIYASAVMNKMSSHYIATTMQLHSDHVRKEAG
jgi:hypothetical protein